MAENNAAATVKQAITNAAEVAALVDAIKKYRVQVMITLILLALGVPGKVILPEVEKQKDLDKELSEALKPFALEAA